MGRGVAAKPRPPQGVPGVGRSGRPGRGLALAPALAPAGPGDRRRTGEPGAREGGKETRKERARPPGRTGGSPTAQPTDSKGK